jgi:hypothetical protein
VSFAVSPVPFARNPLLLTRKRAHDAERTPPEVGSIAGFRRPGACQNGTDRKSAAVTHLDNSGSGRVTGRLERIRYPGVGKVGSQFSDMEEKQGNNRDGFVAFVGLTVQNLVP